MGRVPKTLLAFACVAVLGGCGSGDEGTIPSGDAEELISLLDAVEADLASGDCELAQDHAADFLASVNELPNEVDNDVQGALTGSATRMAELSGDPAQCEQGASGEQGVEETSTSTSTSTTEEETTTSTSTSTTEEETSTSTTEEDSQGGGETGGDGGGGEPEVTIEPPSDSGGIDPGERGTP